MKKEGTSHCKLLGTYFLYPMSIRNKLYHRIEGQGPPLIFIHGILGFWRNFYSVSRAFISTNQVLLYDQRGHGRSFHKKPYQLKSFVQDLKQLVEELGWKKVFLVGHSLGGYVSYLFAHQYPERVQKMVIVDASPWPLEEARNKIQNILLSLPSSFPDRNQAKEFFKQSVEKKIFSKNIADFLMASLEVSSKKSMKFLFDRDGLLELLEDLKKYKIPLFIKDIQTPSLILRGEKSQHFKRSDFEKLLRLKASFTGKEIKNSGHWIHFEQPQEFIKCLKKFL